MELRISLCALALEEGKEIALVTILSRDGSSPRGAGAKMLVTETETSATIGGGALEAKAAEWARQCIRERRPRLLDVDLTGKEKNSIDMACGGRVRLLISYVEPSDENKALFRYLAEKQDQGFPCLWYTAVGGEKDQVRVWQAASGKEQSMTGRLPAWAFPLPGDGQRQELCLYERGKDKSLLAERVCAAAHLYLCGGGHVALKTAQMGQLLGMGVTVFEDRPEFVTGERFPGAERILTPDYEGIFKDIPMGSRDCIVILTRGHRYDTQVLLQAVRTKAGYIGMIGSRRKVAMAMETLRDEGVPEEVIRAVHSPIGLPIGADTPAEIAVSILAEIIQELKNTDQ